MPTIRTILERYIISNALFLENFVVHFTSKGKRLAVFKEFTQALEVAYGPSQLSIISFSSVDGCSHIIIGLTIPKHPCLMQTVEHWKNQLSHIDNLETRTPEQSLRYTKDLAYILGPDIEVDDFAYSQLVLQYTPELQSQEH